MISGCRCATLRNASQYGVFGIREAGATRGVGGVNNAVPAVKEFANRLTDQT
jgi:hypothetical protein